jgi:hypothetical protein
MYSFLLLLLVLPPLFWVWRQWVKRSRLPYPPGPPGLPLLGNLLDVPTQYMWTTFADWSKNYGDIVHVEVFGQHIVVLNTMEIVKDLLDSRSAVYSDREHTTMFMELCVVCFFSLSFPRGCSHNSFSLGWAGIGQ